MLVALIVFVIAELFVIVEVGRAIGALDTIFLLLFVSLVGVALMRRVGLGVWRRAQSRVQAGQVPGREMVDGVLVLAGGALLAVPGFISDVLGLLLFLPPIRAIVRRIALGRIRRHTSVMVIEGRAREVSPPELEP
jgi:UPF0716 protein FxsA